MDCVGDSVCDSDMLCMGGEGKWRECILLFILIYVIYAIPRIIMTRVIDCITVRISSSYLSVFCIDVINF